MNIVLYLVILGDGYTVSCLAHLNVRRAGTNVTYTVQMYIEISRTTITWLAIGDDWTYIDRLISSYSFRKIAETSDCEATIQLYVCTKDKS